MKIDTNVIRCDWCGCAIVDEMVHLTGPTSGKDIVLCPQCNYKRLHNGKGPNTEKPAMGKCSECGKVMPLKSFNKIDDGETVKLLCNICHDQFTEAIESFPAPDNSPFVKKTAKQMIFPKARYHDITYNDGINVNEWNGCKDGHHLFDEVLTTDEHCLFCDACGMEVHISKIVTH